MDKEERSKLGKRSRSAGIRFEKKVREDLKKQGWKVSKWQNNIDNRKCVPAKMGRFRSNQGGFPDFMTFKANNCILCGVRGYSTRAGWDIIFVESKIKGYLTKEEIQKAKWYLENDYCSRFHVAKKGTKRGEIIYKEIVK